MRRAHVLGVNLFKCLFSVSSVESFCEQWFKYTRNEGIFAVEDEAVWASYIVRKKYPFGAT
uniref:RxLR effector candidate protein n=1 Tax=Hyaloperonospora arabidopsidis (strain Emoy2) TaxID=559515 RepID=M4BYY4_HYAAE